MTAACSLHTRDPLIKLVDARSTSATFVNLDRGVYIKTQVDGCVVQGRVAADWLLQREHVGAVIVELKGKDVGHALEQVKSTIDIIRELELTPRAAKLGALIVSTSTPKIALTKVQRVQSELNKQRIKLTVSSSRREFSLADLVGR